MRAFLIAAAATAVLVFSAWFVSIRTKDLGVEIEMPQDMPIGKSVSDLSAPMGEPSGSGLPILSNAMPEFDGIAAWLNSGPLKQADLRGKVVLIDFWTYSCINCIRTLPYVTAWHEHHKDEGFTVIGVHTPEFAFEKEADNVAKAIARHAITYPVALDNDYGTWNNYDNHYWPAHYLFDAQGRLRYAHFGEGKYDETERNIQALIVEAGREASSAAVDLEADVDFSRIGSPETYLGYGRLELLASPEALKRDAVQTYSIPAETRLNRFYLGGRWTVEAERAVASAAGARLVYRYLAANANLVMSPPSDGAGRVEVLLDGKPVPADARGGDVTVDQDGRTYVEVDDERLYDLIRTDNIYDGHLLELRFETPGTAGYAFTFG
jgi:thiol-disulfide isomerase/thioredoxin